MANAQMPHARQYTYIEFPEFFTWHANDKSWSSRQGYYRRISRVAHINPAQGELYYLRMLLHIVKGPKSFSEIRTIAGHEYTSFRAACEALGPLCDDQEWSNALNDAAQWALPYQLQQLFVTLLLFCEVTNPTKLYEDHTSHMSEDIRHRNYDGATQINNPFTYLLIELDKLL
jgi:hypothetical protein